MSGRWRFFTGTTRTAWYRIPHRDETTLDAIEKGNASMKKNLVCLGLGFVLAASVPAADTKDNKEPKEFTSKAGGFSITFPAGKPKETNRGGTNVTATLQTKQGTYGVSYMGLPKDDPNVKKIIPKGLDGFDKIDLGDQGVKFLEQFRDTTLLSGLRGAKVEESKKVKLEDKQTGLESTIILANKQILRHRMFMIGPSIYQITASGSKEFVTSEEADKFFDSFKLTSDKPKDKDK